MVVYIFSIIFSVSNIHVFLLFVTCFVKVIKLIVNCEHLFENIKHSRKRGPRTQERNLLLRILKKTKSLMNLKRTLKGTLSVIALKRTIKVMKLLKCINSNEKVFYKKLKQNMVTYRNYKHFSNEAFMFNVKNSIT